MMVKGFFFFNYEILVFFNFLVGGILLFIYLFKLFLFFKSVFFCLLLGVWDVVAL